MVQMSARRSEAMAIDCAGKTMYFNLTDEVGVVDLAAQKLVERWPVPDAHVQNAMALDEPNHRLFIATRNPPTFLSSIPTTVKSWRDCPVLGSMTI
jgi:hypothetical protein